MTRDAAREAEAMRDLLREWDGWELGCGRPVPAKLSHAKAADTIDALLAENAALRRALEPLARVALPEDFHPSAPGEPAEDAWCNLYTGGLTNGDIRRARKLLPTPPAGGAHG